MPVSLPLFAFKLVSYTNVLHTARTDNAKWWHDHIDYITGKISKSLNIITKLKSHVTKRALLNHKTVK